MLNTKSPTLGGGVVKLVVRLGGGVVNEGVILGGGVMWWGDVYCIVDGVGGGV